MDAGTATGAPCTQPAVNGGMLVATEGVSIAAALLFSSVPPLSFR